MRTAPSLSGKASPVWDAESAGAGAPGLREAAYQGGVNGREGPARGPSTHLHLDVLCGQMSHRVAHRLCRPLHVRLDDDGQRALGGLAALCRLEPCSLGRLEPAQRGAAMKLGV